MSPGRVAVVHGDREWTYRQLDERAARVADVLAGLGVGRGDRVGYLGPNHPALLEVLFGAARLGAVFVPLNWRLALPELAYVLADCGARVVVAAPEHAGAAAQLPGVRSLIVGEQYEGLLAGVDGDPVEAPVGLDDPCVILYTSGTTGRPKGAVLSHGNVTWNCLNLLVDVDLGSAEVTLVAAPMFHVAALNQTVLPTLLKGGRVVLMPAFDPGRVLDLIERQRVTVLFGVPTMFLAIAQAPGWAAADLSSLRTVMCGGAPVPAALIRRYQDRGLSLLQGYGLTEASPGVLFLRQADSAAKAGSAGTAEFFSDVRLVRPDGEPARAGQPGEILVQGPNVMAGYWGRPDDTAAVLSPDGWLRTGDIGILDSDGFIQIRDRVKDLIISGGENIYPAEVEDALDQHPAVAECAVIAVPDPHWGEVGRAIVVLREGAHTDTEDLLGFLADRIARYKIPKSFVFTDALPRTATGKILKSALRSRPADPERGSPHA